MTTKRMRQRITTKRKRVVLTSPCPHGQTLCQRIADDHEGDALRDCPLCEPYAYGLRGPNYALPALLQDSCSDLAKRWSSWMDQDRLDGHRY